MDIFLTILTFFFIYYLGSLVVYGFGNLKKPIDNKLKQNHSVSVIVAVRNGEKALPSLLSDLQNQDYHEKLEFIIVDDDSTDSSANLIKSISKQDSRFIYAQSKTGKTNLSHKKKALDSGISVATGEILLFTDVDCRMGKNWVKNTSEYFQTNIDYIIGYSDTLPTKKWASIFQKLDMFMLMIAAKGITQQGIPWASIGQNQGYRKSLYKKVGGFDKISDCLQGDDSLFLQVCRKIGNIKAVFVDDPETYVTGRTEETWSGFLRQRMRWAGDANLMIKYNKLFFVTIISTFIGNIFPIILIILSIFQDNYYYFSIIILLKLFIEVLLYILGSIKYRKPIDLFEFVFWFLIQMPYIVLMGIMSFWAQNFGWKGRKA
jgi:cellulose synthase/poly-beta-1,6-N-acetylglucosamine synthase-like glycosyltransferase